MTILRAAGITKEGMRVIVGRTKVVGLGTILTTMIKNFESTILVGRERGRRNKADRGMIEVGATETGRTEILAEMNDFILTIKTAGEMIEVVRARSKIHVTAKKLVPENFLTSTTKSEVVIVRTKSELPCTVNLQAAMLSKTRSETRRKRRRRENPGRLLLRMSHLRRRRL